MIARIRTATFKTAVLHLFQGCTTCGHTAACGLW